MINDADEKGLADSSGAIVKARPKSNAEAIFQAIR
jgi:hypothetical protein